MSKESKAEKYKRERDAATARYKRLKFNLNSILSSEKEND